MCGNQRILIMGTMATIIPNQDLYINIWMWSCACVRVIRKGFKQWACKTPSCSLLLRRSHQKLSVHILGLTSWSFLRISHQKLSLRTVSSFGITKISHSHRQRLLAQGDDLGQREQIEKCGHHPDMISYYWSTLTYAIEFAIVGPGWYMQKNLRMLAQIDVSYGTLRLWDQIDIYHRISA